MKLRLTGTIPSDFQRATEELQANLGHSSSLHERCNVLELRDAVLEVGRLIDRLSEFPGPAAVETKERIRKDWKLGWDGIVKKPVEVGVAQVPKLALDEGLLYSTV